MTNRIAELRAAKGWTQQELAYHAGVRVATISDLERGKSNPTLQTLEKIATALEASLLDLFDGDDGDVDLRELIARWAGLSPEERAAILTLVRRKD